MPFWLVICCRRFVRIVCLRLQVVQEDSFDYREDGCVIAQNALIFISRAVETTIPHRPLCVTSVVSMKYSVYRLCTIFDHSKMVIIWMNNFIPMHWFFLFSNIVHGTVVLPKNENIASHIISEMWRDKIPAVFVLMWNDTSFILGWY